LKHFSTPYYILKQFVIVARAIFYRRHSVIGLENIPKDKPIILAPNHQNAFMDPIMIGITLKPQTYFLVRADVFKNPIAAKLLHAVKMMPIYRIRDGVESMAKNEDTFKKVYTILKDKQVVMLFPEGNHGNKKQLRPLKKGAARIAFGAEEAYNYSLDVHVIPVALNYGNFTNAGSTLQVVFSKPIRVADFYEDYKNDPSRTLLTFTHTLHTAMKENMAHWEDDFYVFTENSRKIFEFELSHGTFNVDVELANTKKLYSVLEKNKTSFQDKLPALTEQSQRYLQLIYSNGLKPYAVWYNKHHKLDMVLSWFIIVLSSPVWLFGIVNNVLPFRLPLWIVPKLIKDTHFHSSFKMALKLVTFPFFYAVQFFLMYYFTDITWAVLYILAVPFTGFLSLRLWYFIKMTYYKCQFNRKFDTKQVKEALAIRAELKAFLEPYIHEI
jgi:1-acyl-sn-glycerol-3-phosphate acyltransferase